MIIFVVFLGGFVLVLSEGEQEIVPVMEAVRLLVETFKLFVRVRVFSEWKMDGFWMRKSVVPMICDTASGMLFVSA